MNQKQRIIQELTRHTEVMAEICQDEEASLVTPPGIKFRTNSDGAAKGLYFNDNKQVLRFCTISKQYEVGGVVNATNWEESLPLTPCKYEDLKPGDFCYVGSDREIEPWPCSYRLVLPKKDNRTQLAMIDNGHPKVLDTLFQYYWKIGS